MENLVGKTFGKLTVVKYIDGKDYPMWLCKCQCGNYKEVIQWNLKCGNTKSCGCERGYSRTETKCWNCKNCSICEWSNGIPVPNWKAKPTIIKDARGFKMESYLVMDCPRFEERQTIKRNALLVEEKSKELGISIRTCYRYLKMGIIKL